uniref:Uncharacterized protein n=1 Tax=Schistocephalus solidus TaxID=70667 RepID=A0A0X3PF29_SCHSO
MVLQGRFKPCTNGACVPLRRCDESSGPGCVFKWRLGNRDYLGHKCVSSLLAPNRPSFYGDLHVSTPVPPPNPSTRSPLQSKIGPKTEGLFTLGHIQGLPRHPNSYKIVAKPQH